MTRQQRRKQATLQKSNVPVSTPATNTPITPSSNEAMSFEEGLPRSEYLELRKMYITGEQDSYKSLDSSLLTLSTGVIGLSVTFVHDLIKNPQYSQILFASWICFIITIILVLISFVTAQKDFRKQQEILDSIYHSEQPKKNRWPNFTSVLNILSALCFVAGVAMLVYFGYLNF